MKKIYPIDAFYSFKDNKLHYIIKLVDGDKSKKKIGVINNPDYHIKLAPFNKNINYLISTDKCIDYKLKYKEYYQLRKQLALLYTGNTPTSFFFNKLFKKHKKILSLTHEIYDDYKIETNFLQDPKFTYDDEYFNNISVGIFDIEVYHNDTEFPNATEVKYPINSISTYCYKTNTVQVFIWHQEQHHGSAKKLKTDTLKFLKDKINIPINIHTSPNEQDLIINFLKYIKKFDVLVGWNNLDFDVQYVYNRCVKLKLDQQFKDSFGEVHEILNVIDSKQGRMSKTLYTTKILSIDYIHLIKFYSTKNYNSHSLDYIASVVLKDEVGQSSKVKIPNLNIEYIKNAPNFIYYNIIDVLLNKRIDEKLLFIKLLFSQKKFTRGFTASLMSMNNILDSYISTQCKEYNISCINPIKVIHYYTPKIWNIYRKVNRLSNNRLAQIEKLREKYKGYSICVTEKDIQTFTEGNETENGDITEISNDGIDKINDNDLLNKIQIPFIYKKDKYPGAYVKIPVKGIYVNIVDLDAQAMYPTTLYTTNCSCDTWRYQIPENIALKFIYEQDALFKYLKESNFDIDIYDVPQDKFHTIHCTEVINFFDNMNLQELVITETGAIFVPAHKKVGFFRQLITHPIKNRIKVKGEMENLSKELRLTADDPQIQQLNIEQLVLKITANSVYGFTGFRRSRLFNIILATTITIHSQFLIRYVSYYCDDVIKSTNKKLAKGEQND